MLSDRFLSHFRFALGREDAQIRQDIAINRIEKWGNRLSWFFYDFRKMAVSFFTDPRYITIFFTIFFMTVTSLLFYPSDTWRVIESVFSWVFDHIEWKYVRFGLWFISEMTVLGLGMRALGRFSNPQLMKFHGIV